MSILHELGTPVFAAEGIPADPRPEKWRLRIEGMDGPAVEISLAELKSLPVATVNCRLTSVSGWSVRAEWTGVLWREFLKAFPPRPSATHAAFTSAGGYQTCAPLAVLDHPRVLWAWAVGGEALEPDYGGPLRMVIPNLWGYKSCKWVVRVEFTDRMIPGYWETRGYSVEGAIEPGFTLDVNTRTRRPIPGGEITEF